MADPTTEGPKGMDLINVVKKPCSIAFVQKWTDIIITGSVNGIPLQTSRVIVESMFKYGAINVLCIISSRYLFVFIVLTKQVSNG